LFREQGPNDLIYCICRPLVLEINTNLLQHEGMSCSNGSVKASFQSEPSCLADNCIGSTSQLASEMASATTTTEASLTRDPHEILRASLEFQSSNASKRSSSSSSLYPSMECVNRAASDFDSERDWQNADLSDKKHAASVISENDECHPTSQSSEVSGTAVEQPSGLTEAEADVTFVDYGTIHPLEAESAVQAELVNRVENGHGKDQRLHMNGEHFQESTVEPLLDRVDNNVSASTPGISSEIAPEATVISSGPEEKATRAAWAGDSTEAVVLPTESHTNLFETINDSEKKCASLPNDEVVMVETIPEELSAQAELVRNSSTNNLNSNVVGNEYLECADVVNESETPAEATVLDCGPLDKATMTAWSTPEEAQVLPNGSCPNVSVSFEEEEDQKVLSYADALVQDVSKGPSTNIGNQAEITKISEEFHPVEIESAATAELIANPNGVFPSSGRVYEEAAAADVIVKEEINQAPLVPAIRSDIPAPQPFSSVATSSITSVATSSVSSIATSSSELEACISTRTQLPSSVSYSEETNSWRATLMTVQKSTGVENARQVAEGIRAFDLPTQKQAISFAKAWAPPTMEPFSGHQVCSICNLKFNYIRRACHCRNCGVCVCFCCISQWPSKMIPETYNIKDENTVNVCKACDWLCSEFRLALLNGDCEKALALYSKGNINLTRPFANIKGEVFYPVHCAVLGKSLWLLKWLVEDNCCPMKSITVGNGERGAKKDSYTPILTSKSRSLLNIALSTNSVDIIRYLVLEKNMLLREEKNLPVETLLQTIDSILRAPNGF